MTYGAEHELADWDAWGGLPEGYDRDRRDVTMVNSNGIAVDPRARLYRYGGEVQTPPTTGPAGQGAALEVFLLLFPCASVNYRSNLHIHVRVPGLVRDLRALKRLAAYNQRWLPALLPVLEPIPVPRQLDYPEPGAYKGAVRRMRRRKRSHQTLLTAARAEAQQQAGTVAEFLAAECPRAKDGRVQWHLAPRTAVNLRQLRETNTVEFRHFPGTLEPAQVMAAAAWCGDYLRAALDGGCLTPPELYEERYRGKLPTFPPYVHWMEQRYRATCHDGTVPARLRAERIERWHPGWRTE